MARLLTNGEDEASVGGKGEASRLPLGASDGHRVEEATVRGDLDSGESGFRPHGAQQPSTVRGEVQVGTPDVVVLERVGAEDAVAESSRGVVARDGFRAGEDA